MCDRNKRKWCDRIDCNLCFERSFASHERSRYWSNKNNVLPRRVTKYSHIKYWFKCDQCNHDFDSAINNVVKGQWCPFCPPSPKKLCDNDDCEHCFNQSFASNEKAIFWLDKNKINPRNVFKSTPDKYWFNCNVCGHDFEKQLKFIVGNTFCPYCAIPTKILCDNDDCISCFNRSFASSKNAIFWSNRNSKSPRQVVKCSENKYWFICDKKHEFEMILYSVNDGNWCPHCVNKTETKMFETLTNNGYNVLTQFRADWCKNTESNKCLPFDFLIEEYKIIIELDGGQHFEQVSNWKSPEEQQKTDKYKMACANRHGYTVVRIFQEDVLYDTINWFEEIEQNIYLHDQPAKIYISSNDCYKVYNY